MTSQRPVDGLWSVRLVCTLPPILRPLRRISQSRMFSAATYRLTRLRASKREIQLEVKK